MRKISIFSLVILTLLTSCNTLPNSNPSSTPTPIGAVVPRATQNSESYSLPALEAQATLVQAVLQQPIPVLLINGLDEPRALAQDIAVQDPRFQADLWDASTGFPLRNEIF